MSELKPCPFCGSIELVREYDGDGRAWVVCRRCSCEGPVVHKRQDEGDPHWNTRPVESALQSDLATLRAQNASLSAANEIDLGENAPLIFQITELRARLEEAEEAIVRLAWKECPDCSGAGYAGWSRGRRVSCESCGGHEDSLGDGWIPNHDNIAETMNLLAVARALGKEKA